MWLRCSTKRMAGDADSFSPRRPFFGRRRGASPPSTAALFCYRVNPLIKFIIQPITVTLFANSPHSLPRCPASGLHRRQSGRPSATKIPCARPFKPGRQSAIKSANTPARAVRRVRHSGWASGEYAIRSAVAAAGSRPHRAGRLCAV